MRKFEKEMEEIPFLEIINTKHSSSSVLLLQ